MLAAAPKNDTPPRTRIITEIDVERAGKSFGHLRVPHSRQDSGWGTISVPVVVVKNGQGPTVLLTAGNHGDEYEGQVTLLNLARELDPARVQGRVILLPAMHFPAAMNGTRLSPIDGKDFNRCFPGDPAGSVAQMLAHYVDSFLLPLADFQIDLHSGGTGADIVPSTVSHELDDVDRHDRTIAAARAFGAPIHLVLKEVDAGPTLLAAAENRGIVAMSSELGGLARVNIAGVEITERGARNILKHYGIIDGKPEKAAGYKQRIMGVPTYSCYTFVPAAGLFQPYHAIGTEVLAGQPAGRLLFIDDPARPPIELTYGHDGMLWLTRGQARVQAGDPVAVVASDYPGKR